MNTVLTQVFQGISLRRHERCMALLIGLALLWPSAAFTQPVSSAEPTRRQGASFVILPVMRSPEGALLLWEPDNLWRSVWQGASFELGSGTLIVPAGSDADKAIVSADSVKDATFAQLRPLVERYGTKEAIVAEAAYGGKADEQPTLDVTVRRVSPRLAEATRATYRATEGETREMLLVRAVRDIAQRLHMAGSRLAFGDEAQAHEQKAAKVSRGSRQHITAQLESPRDFSTLREKLLVLPGVKGLEVATLTMGRADLVLEYDGSADALAQSMRDAGLNVTRGDARWTVAQPR